jgi:hypothetical protein
MTNSKLIRLNYLLLITYLLLGISKISLGQNLIKNGGFEIGQPGASLLPSAWYSCGSKGYTPPNLHNETADAPIFEVRTKAKDGDQFVSLVVRKDQSFEGIGQNLDKALEKDSVYLLQLYLNTSVAFESRTKLTSDDKTSFATAADLEIYGLSKSGKYILIDAFTDIEHHEWKSYTSKFKAQEHFKALEFRTYFQFDYLLPYNGHLLIDEISLTSIDVF